MQMTYPTIVQLAANHAIVTVNRYNQAVLYSTIFRLQSLTIQFISCNRMLPEINS